MTKILVIGGASQDILHINEKDIHTTGGAGLYTALGARAAGGQVDMLAPLPSPMPLLMQPINELINWLGPTVSQDELPHFAIEYDSAGKATYTTVEPRAESLMTEDDIPSDLSNYTYVHIVQLGNIDVQLRMIKKCRDSKAQNISVSGGHNLQGNQKEKISTLIEQADLCFMNEHEAANNLGTTKNICSPTGTILFVTHGENGVSIIQGNDLQRIFINPTNPRDPTGAGDSFCGAVLSYLSKLEHPVQAAKKAAKIAKITVSHLGTEGLIQQVSTTPTDSASQASINTNRIRQIAKVMETEEADELPYTFTGIGQPTVGHPNTLDFFFALTLQQFGFWTKTDHKYVAPMIAKIDGHERKGSDYIGAAYSRMLDSDPDFFSVNRQANLSKEELEIILADDDGNCPMPAIEMHLSEAQSYGQDMSDLGMTPAKIIQKTQNSKTPMGDLLRILWNIGGYKNDPLQKKSALLIYILLNRPENFLQLGDSEEELPCIDYHLMRTALRTGMVTVCDRYLQQKITSRALVSEEQEYDVRQNVYKAINILVDTSPNLNMVSVDQFLFRMRKGCPEMSEPDCKSCALDPVCAKQTQLFQPVIRTTYY